MLEIRETFSYDGYENIRESAEGRALHITEAFDFDKKTGFVAYAYGSESTSVIALDYGGDLMLCDGLVRSVMFKSSLKGIKTLVFEISDENILKSLELLGFITDRNTVCGDIDRFMDGCAECRNK